VRKFVKVQHARVREKQRKTYVSVIRLEHKPRSLAFARVLMLEKVADNDVSTL